jgi:uncharacterized membrane protein YraQ (UPF0718 family)
MLADFFSWLFVSFGLDISNRWIASLHFFIVDSIKILFLLFLMIAFVGFLRSYISQEKVKKWLSGKPVISNVVASLFGAVTPFCSCSSIPVFMSFVRAGVPLGVSFSFLITSPLVNEYLVVLMIGFFGLKITLLYVLSGVLIGVFSGLILGKLHLEKHVVKDFSQKKQKVLVFKKIQERIFFGLEEGKSIIRKVWLWVLVGVGLGALMHNLVPDVFIQSLVSKSGLFGVPLAVLLGVPLYASCAAIVPVAVVLFEKGLPLGTALAFMMATSALSFPEAVILRRALKLRLILIFFGVVALAIIVTGYLFNFLS